MNDSSDRHKGSAIDQALATINAMFGAKGGSIAPANRLGAIVALDTGLEWVAKLFGIGGLPRGRVVAMVGPPSIGKTSIALAIAAWVIKNGGTVAYYDAEPLDPEHAKKMGVNMEQMLMVDAPDGQTAANMIAALLRLVPVDLVIMDSVAAMVSPSEIASGIAGDNGAHAKMLNKVMRLLSKAIKLHGTCLLLLNQQRLIPRADNTVQEVTTGGMALQHTAYGIMFLSAIRTIMGPGGPIGTRLLARLEKLKGNSPLNSVEFDLLRPGIAPDGTASVPLVPAAPAGRSAGNGRVPAATH